MALKKCKVSSVHLGWLRQWEIIHLFSSYPASADRFTCGDDAGSLAFICSAASFSCVNSDDSIPWDDHWSDHIFLWCQTEFRGATPHRWLTRLIISHKSKKTGRQMNQPRHALSALVTQWFYFQPFTLFIPYFIIHPSLLSALYPAEQQEVRVWIITIFIQTISYAASLSSFCPWSP